MNSVMFWVMIFCIFVNAVIAILNNNAGKSIGFQVFSACICAFTALLYAVRNNG